MQTATVSLVDISQVWTLHETSLYSRGSPKKFHVFHEFHEKLACSDWPFHETVKRGCPHRRYTVAMKSIKPWNFFGEPNKIHEFHETANQSAPRFHETMTFIWRAATIWTVYTCEISTRDVAVFMKRIYFIGVDWTGFYYSRSTLRQQNCSKVIARVSELLLPQCGRSSHAGDTRFPIFAQHEQKIKHVWFFARVARVSSNSIAAVWTLQSPPLLKNEQQPISAPLFALVDLF